LSETAIKVESLGKRYRIGATASYKTIRESLINTVSAPFRHSRSSLEEKMGHKPSYIWALKDVSFEIKRGQAVGIIGANGSGKSTLLKILSRITRPTEGRVRIFGRVSSLLEVGTGFHPELTGRENIQLNAAVLGMSKAEVMRKFDSIIDFAGDTVKNLIDTPVKRYSSGMYVRLAFAIAAHVDPDILLVDEVLAVGDAEFQKKCLGKMGEVAQSGRTVIFVSHNMSAITQLCDRAILIHSGKVIKDGPVAEVIPQYLNILPLQLGQVIFKYEINSKGVRLLQAMVTYGDLNPVSFVDFTKSFWIVIQYEIDSLIKGLRIGLRLYNSRNVAILQTATSYSNLPQNLIDTQGQHFARVCIPGSWLTPGRYYLEIGTWSPAVGHHQHILNAFGFDIIGDNLKDFMNDVLHPLLDWKLE
jgi:lipopolysaccharide transport system ATP-binding protein